MPRTGKGGKRQGDAQTAYSNRTDLNNRGPQPIAAAPGEPYGQRQMLEDAQRAVPMAGTPIPQAPPSMPQGGTNLLENPQAPQHQGIQHGDVDLFAPAPHPMPEPRSTGANPSLQLAARAPARLADLLGEAAASPYATHAVQELAAVAKNLGI